MSTFHVTFPSLNLSFDINNIAFSIGDYNIYWYGIIIGIGFILAFLYAMKNLKRFGISADKFLDCVIVGLITAVLGARLYYVLFRWDMYKDDFASIFAIHDGGLAIYGGIIGALLGGCIVAKIVKQSIPAILDIAALGFLIGQGIGRWGNFVNQEAFGTPTDLPWGMMSENTAGQTVHPCFLYESLWCLLGFVLLHIFSRKFRKYDGQIFLLYLAWYGLERMIVEGLRTDSLYTPFLNLRVSQILAAVTMVTAVILLIVFRKRTVKAVDTAASLNAEKATDSVAEQAEGATESMNADILADDTKEQGDSAEADAYSKNDIK